MFRVASVRHAAPEKAGFNVYRPTGYAGYTLLHFHNSVRVSAGGEMVTTKPHACILYAPRTPQFFETETALTYDWLHFSADIPLPESMQCDTVYYPSNHTRITNSLQEIESEYFAGRVYGIEIMSLKTHELLVLLSRDANSELGSAVSHKVRKKLADVRTYVFSHLDQEWTVEKMASRVYLSASHFHSIYRKLFGKTPTDDLIAARVYAAQLALTFSDEPLTSIATRLGYHSLSHFVRQYSAIQGCSPAKYRKLYASERFIRTGSAIKETVTK